LILQATRPIERGSLTEKEASGKTRQSPTARFTIPCFSGNKINEKNTIKQGENNVPINAKTLGTIQTSLHD
jgi:hypothetical protein